MAEPSPVDAPEEKFTSPAEHVHTFAPYVVLLIVWAVTAADPAMPAPALTMANDLFGAMLLLINPTQQFVKHRRAKKSK